MPEAVDFVEPLSALLEPESPPPRSEREPDPEPEPDSEPVPDSDAALEPDPELEPPLESLEPLDWPEPLDSEGVELFGVRVAARSFLAQPEPLNRMAGVLKPFRSVPSAPQLGQKRGAGSLIPWMTSVRCEQLEQT